MADNSQIAQYPFMFDPSQFSNKYSSFAGMSLNPFMGQYNGGSTGPTDAHGNPIQSYLDAQKAHDAWQPPAAQGTTLNTSPQSNIPQYIYAPGGQYTGGGNNYDQMAGKNTPAQYVVNPAYAMSQQGMGQQQAKPAAPAAPTNPIDMNQAYLAALANPGKVTTQGATVPQAAPPSNQSGVLQQFLTNWQNQGSPTQGAGNYNNAGFFNSLKGMV